MEFECVLDGEDGNQTGWMCSGHINKREFISELTKQHGDPDYRFDICLVNYAYTDRSGGLFSTTARGRTPVTLIEQVAGSPIEEGSMIEKTEEVEIVTELINSIKWGEYAADCVLGDPHCSCPRGKICRRMTGFFLDESDED